MAITTVGNAPRRHSGYKEDPGWVWARLRLLGDGNNSTGDPIMGRSTYVMVYGLVLREYIVGVLFCYLMLRWKIGLKMG